MHASILVNNPHTRCHATDIPSPPCILVIGPSPLHHVLPSLGSLTAFRRREPYPPCLPGGFFSRVRNQTRWPVSQAHLPAARDRMHRAKHRHILHLWQRTSQITRDTRGTSKWDDQGSSGETCTLISADFPQDHWGGEIEVHGRQAPSSHGRRIIKWTVESRICDEVKTMTIPCRAYGLWLSKRCRRDQILGGVVRGGKIQTLVHFSL